MGQHAFKNEPEHCAVYRQISRPPLPVLFGFKEEWDLPIVRHRAVLESGSEFAGVPHYILTYHISGAPTRRTDNPELSTTARTGASSLQIPNSKGTFESLGGKAVEYAHLYFQPSLLEEVASEGALKVPHQDCFGVVDLNLQRDIMAYLERAQDRRWPATTQEMDTRARLVIYSLLRSTNNPLPAEAQMSGLTDRQVQKIEDSALARLRDPIRLSELAEVAGMSPYHFARKFKQATGETPAAYVMRLRVERAFDLLQTTSLSVSEIAYQTGFSSQSHLSRRLRQTYNMTPGQLREHGEKLP